MDELLNVVIKVVATLLAFGIAWIGKYLLNLLKGKLNEQNAAKLDLFVAELVAAAEQMYKKDDPDGTVRLGYVQDMLIQAGYEITGAVMALIESKVFSINLANAAPVEEVESKPVYGFQADPEGGEAG